MGHSLKATRIGEEFVNTQGEKAKIVDYINANHITIQFEDGTILKNKTYSILVKGAFKKPLDNRVGEEFTNTQGYKAKIIEYNNCYNVTIQFDDGTILKNKSYSSLKSGYFKKPVYTMIGEEFTNTQGYKAKVIEYNDCKHITVQFEDGTILKNLKRYKLLNGQFEKPVIQTTKVGEEFTNSQGYKAKIIEYINYSNITIQFEDGTILKNKRYDNLTKGMFKKPLCTTVGERRQMNCGVTAEIIEYNSYNDITVKFDTGEIRKGVSYSSFYNRTLGIKDIKEIASERVGYIFKTTCGLNAKIVEYKRVDDITIKFEDDTVVEHANYNRILKGKIKYTTITCNGTGTLKSFKLHKRVYNCKDMTLYHCTCQKCGIENVLTPQEMLKHECN